MDEERNTEDRPDRAEVAAGHEQVVERILARVAEAVDPVRAECAVAFGRAAYRRVTPGRLLDMGVDAAAALLARAFSFVDARTPGELALRVYNPSRDEHGWSWAGAAVEINVEDGPFLLSTVTEELTRLGATVLQTIHPIFGVARDERGRLEQIVPARTAAQRETWMLLELAETLEADALREVEASLRAVLGDARAAARDYAAMRAQIDEMAFQVRASAGGAYARDEIDETLAFLAWLLDDHFVFLGYREYDLVEEEGETCGVVTRGSGLGILSDESSSMWSQPVPLSQVPSALRARTESGDLLVVSRTNRISTVHRRQRMLYVGVKKLSGTGEVVGEYRLLGLFAQKAHAHPASAIPVLRRKLRQVLEREDVVDHSYDERVFRGLFEALPKDELFQMDVDQLRRTLVVLVEAEKSREVAVIVTAAPDRRSLSVVVALPRDRFTASLRDKVHSLLVEECEAAGADEHLALTERDQALLHFVLYPPPGARAAALDAVDIAALERDVHAITRSWEDVVRDALLKAYGGTEGERLLRTWLPRFTPAYRETTTPESAVADIAQLVGLETDGDIRLAVREDPARDDRFRFTLYRAGPGVELSSFLPILEHLGLVVIEEIPHRLDGVEIQIHNFAVRTSDPDVSVEAVRDGQRLADAARAVWEGRTESDSLNRLVLHGLEWDDVAVLRAYRRYRRQVGVSFTEAYQNDALVDNADVAAALIHLFSARFDPRRDASREQVDAARQQVLEGCDAVQRLDQDRILRGFLGLIDATTRTNRYLRRPYLSFKLASAQVPAVPKPIPFVEVFVYSPEMEGIHLRGGPVARGGIRWSDRLEDFRTEVLGLMKAQMVKNAVIVPTGSKGGFVLKRAPKDAQALRTEVRRQYEVLIRGLLDITDNVVEGVVVPPEGVRRWDGDDVYLVVAADRGTATFSDLANAISAEYAFWLGDAFAAGGSSGYDHKAMGITARGAWVAVQRHFRELDIDVQTEEITVVGIGDMSGDVFGNGMLRSRTIKLVAAFDHRDIFIDPDPDPEASFAERARLFALPASSWRDYDPTVISTGGGVWPRVAKEIALSEQARAALRIDTERVSPADLMRAILKAPVDLLFAGGIGTFVKATGESNSDVGDRANDAVRVNGDEVGARVVGEGGNLAFTQLGRVQYARRGGRINTDAIDNSAGVDTSDHEVNLKILFGAAIADGRLTREARDELLATMTDDVAAAVLRDVYLQTWAISQEAAGAPAGLEPYEALMVRLEELGKLDRDVEALPHGAEMQRRAQATAGLTRPELAVLLGYAKTDLTAELLDAELPDQPYLRATLDRYFPALVVEQFPDLVADHRLRRELIATIVANDLVNRMGSTWAVRMSREYGAEIRDVAAAYWIARDVADADAHWRAIEALDGVAAPDLQLELKGVIDVLVDNFARAYLRQGSSDISVAVQRDRPAFERLEKVLHGGGSGRRRSELRAGAKYYEDLGIDGELARRVLAAGQLSLVPDVAAVARQLNRSVEDVTDVFLRVAELLPLENLHERLQAVHPAGHWARWQRHGLVDELRRLRREVAARAAEAYRDLPGGEPAERFIEEHAHTLQRVDTVVRMLDEESEAGLDGIAVAVRLLREALTES